MGKTFKNGMREKDYYKDNMARYDKQHKFFWDYSMKLYRRVLKKKYNDVKNISNGFLKKLSHSDWW